MVSLAITKRLSPHFVVDVGLDAPPGITILFGASGSGKTTVLRCVAGLTRPDTGRIAIGDRVLFDAAGGVDVPVQQRHVGYVFQQLALFPHLSVRDNIGYGLHALPEAERRSRVARIADAFHIAAILDRKPPRISGGERQRAALARSLVTDPEVLLLDEPLSALDHAIQSRIIADLQRWNEAHRIPILYVTHAHREVFALGERVVVLEGGRVLATGSPHEVLDHPAHGALANLAGFENVFDATIVERHERAGTMRCRLEASTTELEVPLTHSPAGARIRVAIRAGDILLASEQPHGLSARNVFRGEVIAIAEQGPTLVATVHAGSRFVVHLTPDGARSMGLRTGGSVWLIVKTYSCRTSPSDTMRGDLQ